MRSGWRRSRAEIREQRSEIFCQFVVRILIIILMFRSRENKLNLEKSLFVKDEDKTISGRNRGGTAGI